MSRWMPLVVMLGTAAVGFAGQEPASPSGRPLVLVARLDDEPITPGVDRYLQRAIRQAEQRGAECLVVVLDTPGGLLDSTRSIVKQFLATDACVVVYVAPSGSRAASAGVFITLASHVAAMAPGTTIGAAHPVQTGVLPFQSPDQQPPSPDQQDEQDEQDEQDKPPKDKPSKDEAERPADESKDGEFEEEESGEAARDAEGQSPAAAKPPENSEAKAKTNAETEAEDKEDEDDGVEEPRRPRTVMEEKVLNDTVAWVRALARLRGRNVEWATRAVKQSVSVTAEEAAEERVVEILAEDLDDLLAKLDGREVSLPQGPRELNTAGATVEEVEMWWGELVLAMVSRPNVAFLLMIFGFYGVLFELYSPGWGVAGTLGVVCLLLAMFGLAVLPVNYLGLALIAVALLLFVAEVFVTSFGALTVGGVVCLVLGGIMLVDSPAGFLRVSPAVVVPLAVATAAIVVFLVGGIIRAHRRKPTTGDEGLIGRTAEAHDDFAPRGDCYVGTVFVRGEWWKATSDAPVAAGCPCAIRGRKGLTLLVSPARTTTSEN